MLSNIEIKRRLNKDIKIDPFNEENLNPNSYDVTLSNDLYIYNEDVLDLNKKPSITRMIIPSEGLVLRPNKLYIGHTNEYTETYNLVPMINGKSSLGKIGLFTNISSSMGNAGYKGVWSIQLMCFTPVRIYPNMKIAQLYYEEIIGEIDNNYIPTSQIL